MGVIDLENLSSKDYNSILEMIDEMERNGLVEIARKKSKAWIEKYSNCKSWNDFYHKSSMELK